MHASKLLILISFVKMIVNGEEHADAGVLLCLSLSTHDHHPIKQYNSQWWKCHKQNFIQIWEELCWDSAVESITLFIWLDEPQRSRVPSSQIMLFSNIYVYTTLEVFSVHSPNLLLILSFCCIMVLEICPFLID